MKKTNIKCGCPRYVQPNARPIDNFLLRIFQEALMACTCYESRFEVFPIVYGPNKRVLVIYCLIRLNTSFWNALGRLDILNSNSRSDIVEYQGDIWWNVKSNNKPEGWGKTISFFHPTGHHIYNEPYNDQQLQNGPLRINPYI